MRKKRNRRITGRTIIQKQLPKENPTLEEIAKGQKDWDVIKTDDNYSGEASPYWQWMEANSQNGDGGEIQELPEANPDYIRVTESTDLRETFIEVYSILTDREKQVFGYLKVYKTDSEIAEKLGISTRAVNKIRNNIAKKVLKSA